MSTTCLPLFNPKPKTLNPPAAPGAAALAAADAPGGRLELEDAARAEAAAARRRADPMWRKPEPMRRKIETGPQKPKPMWEFPKIGDPNLVLSIVGSLFSGPPNKP